MPWGAGDPVQTHLTVTHVGTHDPIKTVGARGRVTFHFQCGLRPVKADQEPEDYVSVYIGRLTLDEAAVRITLGQTTTARSNEAVRYAEAQTLLNAGFNLTHEPDACDEHAAVRYEGDWTDEVANRFAACFREHLL